MTYRPTLTGHALTQFTDLTTDTALIERILRLVEEPWDAWPVYPGGDEPAFRETQFGDHGLLSFRVDDDAEVIIIFNILWTG